MIGPHTFEYIRYSFANFVHPNPQNPYERFLYTKGAWFNPATGESGVIPPSGGITEGLFVRSLFPSETILAVADVFSPLNNTNASFVLTGQNQVDAILYSVNGGLAGGGGFSNIYLPVQDPYGGAFPPQFLEQIAALVDIDTQEIHAITLASDNHGNSAIIDWFGTLPIMGPADVGSWTVIPLFLATVPGGRLVAASYSPSLKEREILIATADTIKLIRYTSHGADLEDFASFPGEKIISLTSFSVPDDTAQRAIVATTSNDLDYQLWEISYERNVAQPFLIGTLTNFNLAEISGYANPTDQRRHIAMISSGQSLYRGSYNRDRGGFQYTPWPGVPFAGPNG